MTGDSGLSTPPRLWLSVLVMLIGMMLSPKATIAETVIQREDRIKAALIFKLVKFVEWPATAMNGKDPIQICALGDSRVGEALSAVDGKPTRDRLAQFRRIASLSPTEFKGCHVLYVPSAARELGVGVPFALRGRSILTVSDAPDFARRGGMVCLGQGENKLSFEINLRNTREGGLEPGAPLLELATIIE
ncbi:MAG TPA: YfiR family protein [Accumulibacter sp.]|jgi:hypothetical protein|nr:YfiR family protein [Accumulibacter sp.]HQC79352.1 YfiR family protein [Accumulibacter sp.]